MKGGSTTIASVDYTLDDVGNRTQRVDQQGTHTYAYDDLFRLTSVTYPGPSTTTYDVDSNRTGISRSNGVTSTYAYDAAARVSSIVHALGGATIESFTYGYDNADNRVSLVSSAGTESYTVDGLNRLTGVTYPNGDVVSYTYDAAGNRLTQTFNGSTTTYSYDSASQLTTDGTSTYTYDADGNLVSRGTDSFSWGYDGRMTGATVGSVASTYSYDADGTRVSKTVGGVATTFVWDRESGLPLMIDDGTEGYVYEHGNLLSRLSGTTTQFGLEDALGSGRLEANGSGTVSSTSAFDVFGAVRSSTGTPGAFGFTGEYLDQESGWTFLRARYLDPVIGRLPSGDPISPSGPGTGGWNPYSYVTNAPQRYTDRSGETATVEYGGLRIDKGTLLVGFTGIAIGVTTTIMKLVCALTPACRTIHNIIVAAGGAVTNPPWHRPTWPPPPPPPCVFGWHCSGGGDGGTGSNGSGGSGSGTGTSEGTGAGTGTGVGTGIKVQNPPRVHTGTCADLNFNPLAPPLFAGQSGPEGWGLAHIAECHYYGAGQGASEFTQTLSNWAALSGLGQMAHRWRSWVPSGSRYCRLTVPMGFNIGRDRNTGPTDVLTVIAEKPNLGGVLFSKGVITMHPGYPNR